MRTRLFVIGLLLAAAGGVAEAKRPTPNYAAYAGPPVNGFTYRHLYNLRRASDKQVVVYTRPSTAYLLTLREDCEILPGRMTFEIGGVDAIMGRVRADSQDLLIGSLRCQVHTIQPLDVARMKADRA